MKFAGFFKGSKIILTNKIVNFEFELSLLHHIQLAIRDGQEKGVCLR